MTTATSQATGLDDFLKTLEATQAASARSLSAGWQSGGGAVQTGNVAVRLRGTPKEGEPFTAATIYGTRANGPPPRLELCRVILLHHGLDENQWTHWSDDFLELSQHGFDARAKYPTVPLEALTPTDLARLVGGMRDLAAMVNP